MSGGKRARRRKPAIGRPRRESGFDRSLNPVILALSHANESPNVVIMVSRNAAFDQASHSARQKRTAAYRSEALTRPYCTLRR